MFTTLTGIMKARKVIEKAPVKLRNIAKLGTLIDTKPVKRTINNRYTILLNYNQMRLLIPYSWKGG